MTEEHSLKMTALNLTGGPQEHPVPTSALIKHVPEGERPPRLQHSPALVISQSRNVGNKTLVLWAASRSWRNRNPMCLPVPKSCSSWWRDAQSSGPEHRAECEAVQSHPGHRSQEQLGCWCGLCSCATGGSWSPAQGTLAEVAQGRVSCSSPAAAQFSCSCCCSREW